MATHDRRSVLAALGLAVPFGIDTRAIAAGPPPGLRFRPFEDAVREAFASPDRAPVRRVEVGHSDEVRAGLQGCHNDRLFAGFAAGRLRIVRTGAAPGPVVGGVRLYVATVDIAVSQAPEPTGRPFDFASLPPVPVLVPDQPPTAARPAHGSPRTGGSNG
jgi:hypothetical protein